MKVTTDRHLILELILFVGLLGLSEIAIAYVGPGAGLTLIGSLIGLLIAILTALGIILFWPVRALIRRIRAKKVSETTETTDSTTSAPQNQETTSVSASSSVDTKV